MRNIIEFVRPAQVWHELGISPATGWRWVDLQLLPKPVKIGPNSTAFIREELERAKAALISAGATM
jgi:predicted DNA-binding transcriptional regulator AlpA